MLSQAAIDKRYTGKQHVLGVLVLVFPQEEFCPNLEVSHCNMPIQLQIIPMENKHTCVWVCVSFCLQMCGCVFFICKSNISPTAVFRQYLVGRQHRRTINTLSSTHVKTVWNIYTCMQTCVCLAYSHFTVLKVSTIISVHAAKDKTLSSKISFSKSLKDMHGHLHIFLRYHIHRHTPWEYRDTSIISLFLPLLLSLACWSSTHIK